MANISLFDKLSNILKPEPYNTDPIAKTMGKAIKRLNTLKNPEQTNRPDYPEELTSFLVGINFDRSRIQKVDEDIYSSSCSFAIEDKLNPSTTEGGYIWIEVPIQWLEEETERQLKEGGQWLDYAESGEHLISDWLQCYLYEYERKAIIDKVFNRLLTDIFQSIEVLPA